MVLSSENLSHFCLGKLCVIFRSRIAEEMRSVANGIPYAGVRIEAELRQVAIDVH